MFRDARGLAITAASQEAVDAFDACVETLLSAGRDAGLLLSKIDAVDPEMPMGQCLRGYSMLLPSREAMNDEAPVALDTADKLAAGATERERRHVEALRAWVAGDLGRALAAWEAILIEDPHDILAMRLAHNQYFFIGDLPMMRDSIVRVAARWDDSLPGYGYLLGCHGFALEENGIFAEAERLGRQAVEINEADIWAGHCVAHVLEMQGRRSEGIAWVDEHEPCWKNSGTFARHLWWHRSLHYLEMERLDDLLAAFDREVWPEPSEDNIDIGNAASILMRLEMLGVDVGDRWDSVAGVCAGRVDERLRPFNDLHFLMALAMGGFRTAAEETLASMKAFRDAHLGTDISIARVYQDAGVPVGEAILAYADKNYARVVTLMLEARPRMVPLGGSWAQRDVWVRMLIEAARRSGQHALARALLAERTAANPTSGPSWKLYAEELDQGGMADEAEAARQRASEALAA